MIFYKRKTIFYFSVLVMLFFQFISLYKGTWSSSNSDSFVPYMTTSINVVNYISIFLFVILGIDCLLKYKKNVDRIILFGITILTLSVFYWTVLSLFEVDFITLLYISSNPFAYLVVLTFFIGFDDCIWKSIRKYFMFFAITFVLFSLYFYFTHMGLAFFRNGNTPIISYLVQGFWFLCFSSMAINKNTIYHLTIYLLSLVVILICILSANRSFILQTLLMNVAYINKLTSRSVLLKFIGMVILLSLLFAAFTSLNKSTNSSFDLMKSRISQDTRTYQYIDFFSQVGLSDLMMGKGINASYHSSLYNEQYSYIDNQILFMLFRYGVCICAVYLLLLIYPMFMLFNKRLSLKKKYPAIILLLWIFAISGLSIYNGVVFDLKNIMVMMLAGRCYYIAKMGNDL